MTSGFLRAQLRLLSVQGAWNFERMTGVGLGFAAEPLLEDLKSVDPGRHLEASIRSAEYFNSHPYLAGLALGALVRAEYDQIPGAQISRLRLALASPLGALGDQLFWAGLVPATIALGMLAVSAGRGIALLAMILALYNLGRLATGVWALKTGLASGIRVGGALGASWLPRAIPLASAAASLLVGAALPVAAAWLLGNSGSTRLLLMVGAAAVGLVASWRFGPAVTAFRYGMVVIALAALIAGGRS